MGKRTKEGMCHICGEFEKLTFEHVPPRSLGNDRPRNSYSAVKMLKQGRAIEDTEGIYAKIQQQGSGGHTLCQRCNSYLGSNYVPAYNQFILNTVGIFKQAAKVHKEENNFIVVEMEKVDGLAVFKQILSMICCLSQPGPLLECKEFLLDKNSNEFNTNKYQVFMYAILDDSSKSRSTGWVTPVFTDFTSFHFTDYAQYPLGYRIYDMETPPKRYYGCNITELSKLKYGIEATLRVNLPIDSMKGALPIF